MIHVKRLRATDLKKWDVSLGEEEPEIHLIELK